MSVIKTTEGLRPAPGHVMVAFKTGAIAFVGEGVSEEVIGGEVQGYDPVDEVVDQDVRYLVYDLNDTPKWAMESDSSVGEPASGEEETTSEPGPTESSEDGTGGESNETVPLDETLGIPSTESSESLEIPSAEEAEDAST